MSGCDKNQRTLKKLKKKLKEIESLVDETNNLGSSRSRDVQARNGEDCNDCEEVCHDECKSECSENDEAMCVNGVINLSDHLGNTIVSWEQSCDNENGENNVVLGVRSNIGEPYVRNEGATGGVCNVVIGKEACSDQNNSIVLGCKAKTVSSACLGGSGQLVLGSKCAPLQCTLNDCPATGDLCLPTGCTEAYVNGDKCEIVDLAGTLCGIGAKQINPDFIGNLPRENTFINTPKFYQGMRVQLNGMDFVRCEEDGCDYHTYIPLVLQKAPPLPKVRCRFFIENILEPQYRWNDGPFETGFNFTYTEIDNPEEYCKFIFSNICENRKPGEFYPGETITIKINQEKINNNITLFGKNSGQLYTVRGPIDCEPSPETATGAAELNTSIDNGDLQLPKDNMEFDATGDKWCYEYQVTQECDQELCFVLLECLPLFLCVCVTEDTGGTCPTGSFTGDEQYSPTGQDKFCQYGRNSDGYIISQSDIVMENPVATGDQFIGDPSIGCVPNTWIRGQEIRICDLKGGPNMALFFSRSRDINNTDPNHPTIVEPPYPQFVFNGDFKEPKYSLYSLANRAGGIPMGVKYAPNVFIQISPCVCVELEINNPATGSSYTGDIDSVVIEFEDKLGRSTFICATGEYFNSREVFNEQGRGVLDCLPGMSLTLAKQTVDLYGHNIRVNFGNTGCTGAKIGNSVGSENGGTITSYTVEDGYRDESDNFIVADWSNGLSTNNQNSDGVTILPPHSDEISCPEKQIPKPVRRVVINIDYS